MIVLSCRKLQCLSVSQKYTSSIISFLRYYILKNPAIWLASTILAHNSNQNFAKYEIGGEISTTKLVLIFDYFLEKLMTKSFIKSKKPYFRAIWGPFFPNLGKNEFSRKKRLLVFKYSNYLPSCKNPEKTNEPFLRKIPNWEMDGQTDRRIDNSDFIEPSEGWVSNLYGPPKDGYPNNYFQFSYYSNDFKEW